MYHTRGLSGLFPYFAADRPVQAAVDAFGFLLAGENPALWHGYALALRLLGAWALLWMLRGLWPRQRFATTAAALLFIVYPGFLQQSIAQTYSSHFLVLLLAILSISLSLRAMAESSRSRFVALTVTSMLLCAAYLWLLEYAVGLEALRLLLIAYVAGQDSSRYPAPARWSARLRRIVRCWLPYLLVTTAFLIWRIFVFQSQRPDTDIGFATSGFVSSPLNSLLTLPLELARSFVTVTALAWANIVPVNGVSLSAFGLSLGLALVVVIGIGAYARWLRGLPPDADESPSAKCAKTVFAVGAVSVMGALLLPVIVNRAPVLNDAYDRYTLPAMLGAALTVVGFIYTFVKSGRTVLLCGLVAFAVMMQFHAGNIYRAHWDVQQNMWWQFAWRVPALQPDTLLIANAPEPTTLVPIAPHALYAPAHILYAPAATEPQFGSVYLFGGWINMVMDGLRSGAAFQGGWRSYALETSYRNSLIVYYDGLSCLRVIDPQRLELSRSGRALLDGAAPYSHPERIRTDAGMPAVPETLFGPEPPHTWCYFFQKADLARQRGDWDEVTRLGDEARERGFKALDASEWFVFIEGYLRAGRIDSAQAVIQQNIALDDLIRIRPDLCDWLERVPAGNSSAIQAELECGALLLILPR